MTLARQALSVSRRRLCSLSWNHPMRACPWPVRTARRSNAALGAADVHVSQWYDAIVRGTRHFTISQSRPKKNNKKARDEEGADEAQEEPKESASNPFDFSELEAGIAKAQERLRDGLGKLRPGGRLGPDVLERLRVRPSKDDADSVRMDELAQVIPRSARILNILVADQVHIKPIISAIQNSDLNLTPLPDAQNALQLNITLPTVTAESRKLAVQEAAKVEQGATNAVRDSRQAQHKKLRAMKNIRSNRPDDLKKAEAQMGKLVEKALADVKKIADAAKRALESG